MITLVFKDQYSHIADKEFRLEVPDFPYTEAFCFDGYEMRLCVSPLEFDTARGDLQAFMFKLPAQAKNNGFHRMELIHDELGLLATWYHVNIVFYRTVYGVEAEITTLKDYVKV